MTGSGHCRSTSARCCSGWHFGEALHARRPVAPRAERGRNRISVVGVTLSATMLKAVQDAVSVTLIGRL
jgi:hypothetical protein